MLALLAQLASVEGDVRANAERAASALGEHPEADIAVFPELFLSGYTTSELEHLTRRADAAELRLVADAAAKTSTAVLIGFAEERGSGRPANAAACIDRDGRLAAVYRKTQLFGAEQQAFEPGEGLMVVELAGKRVGPLICFDAEFPEPARSSSPSRQRTWSPSTSTTRSGLGPEPWRIGSRSYMRTQSAISTA